MQDLLCNDVFVGDWDTAVGPTHATPTGSRLLAGVVKRKEKVIFKKDSEEDEEDSLIGFWGPGSWEYSIRS